MLRHVHFTPGVDLLVDWYDDEHASGRVRAVIYTSPEDEPEAAHLARGIGVPVQRKPQAGTQEDLAPSPRNSELQIDCGP